MGSEAAESQLGAEAVTRCSTILWVETGVPCQAQHRSLYCRPCLAAAADECLGRPGQVGSLSYRVAVPESSCLLVSELEEVEMRVEVRFIGVQE